MYYEKEFSCNGRNAGLDKGDMLAHIFIKKVNTILNYVKQMTDYSKQFKKKI